MPDLTAWAAPPWIAVGAPGAPAFQNGWANFGGGFEDLRFYEEGGIVRLQGLVTRAAGASLLPIFTLPVGYRPAASLQLPGYTAGCQILSPSGEVQPLVAAQFFGFGQTYRIR
jgi:hypothetical protein